MPTTGYCFTGAMFVKAHVPNVINVPLRKYVRNCSKGVNLNKGMSKNIMQAFRDQCEAYLVKPITKEALVKELTALGLIAP